MSYRKISTANWRSSLSVNALHTFISYENGGLQVFLCFVRFLVEQTAINAEKCIGYGKYQQPNQ